MARVGPLRHEGGGIIYTLNGVGLPSTVYIQKNILSSGFRSGYRGYNLYTITSYTHQRQYYATSRNVGVRFPMESLGFFRDFILPAAL